MANKQGRLLALLAAACLLLPAASAATAVEYCSEYPTTKPSFAAALGYPVADSAIFFFLLRRAEKGNNYPVKVSGVEIVPDPVAPGQPATFKIIASTGKSQRFTSFCFTYPDCGSNWRFILLNSALCFGLRKQSITGQLSSY
jgi:hypothetical protein